MTTSSPAPIPPSPVRMETLEDRRMLSAAPSPAGGSVVLASSHTSQPLRNPNQYLSESLTADEVRLILSQAASQARPGQIIVVTDREGFRRGAYQVGQLKKGRQTRIYAKAIARARTAAFFQSTQNAFTTRTARFIIQDHFPHPVQNTPGGPLYGVEFSTLADSDVPVPAASFLPAGNLNITGDPGGIPLFKNGIPVGGIGVAGDGHDVAARRDLIGTLDDPDNPRDEFYNGAEESDFDEAVALAGAHGFLPNPRIRADQTFIDGLRFPFTADRPASGNPVRSIDVITAAGQGGALLPPQNPFAPVYGKARYAGVRGQLKTPGVPGFGVRGSDDPDAVKLEIGDVNQIITDAVRKAISLRAAIREPQGVPARVHVAVVDRDGDVLGVFRMADGTNFSYDVAVQKARTAAFFSGQDHAFSTRAIGFMAQPFFAPGIKSSEPGPLFKIQNQLSLNAGNRHAPLANGITIFPGGVPLYKNGVFVGAVGISGDGVDQDDFIAFSGGQRYAPPKNIRSDHLGDEAIVQFVRADLQKLFSGFGISQSRRDAAFDRLDEGFDDLRLPYVKFPRDPDV